VKVEKGRLGCAKMKMKKWIETFGVVKGEEISPKLVNLMGILIIK
jgi:hypothetical protein